MEADFIAVENMLRCFKHAVVEDIHRNQNNDSLLTAVSIDYTQPLLSHSITPGYQEKKEITLTNKFPNELNRMKHREKW